VLDGRKSRHILDWIQRKTENECTGQFKATRVNTNALNDFSVYEMINGTYVINATFGCQIEIEYEYYIKEYDMPIDIG
jgi:hypothetical protein